MAHWSGEWGNSGGEWEGDEATTGASFDRWGGWERDRSGSREEPLFPAHRDSPATRITLTESPSTPGAMVGEG